MEESMLSLKGKKIAILVANGFEQVELEKPQKALQDAGAETAIISPESMVMGWNHDEKGNNFSVDVQLDHVNHSEYDGLLLPGGVMNPDTLRINAKAIAFVKAINDSGKPIAAICHGPWILINANMVKDRNVTSWSSIKLDLENAGAQWQDQAVVIDGNLLTSRKPDDIPEFNKAMIDLFH